MFWRKKPTETDGRNEKRSTVANFSPWETGRFKPHEDITTYELARVVQYLTGYKHLTLKNLACEDQTTLRHLVLVLHDDSEVRADKYFTDKGWLENASSSE